TESLKKLDRNGDGKLTDDELRPERGPGGPPRGDRADGPGSVGRERDPAGRGPGDREPGDRESGSPGRRVDGAGPGGPGPRGPGGPGRDGRGPDGREGAGPGGPGRAGPPSVLPPFAREQLRLTDEQLKKIDELDAEVRGRMDKILTA